MPDFECWICLDFGDLPDLGPCPDCHPDAYAEHVLNEMDASRTTSRREGCDV